MKRDSATLFLESPGATTPLPWVNDAPDFSGFTEPTLSVLQQSWAAFLESGQELEVIPDPPPPPPLPPEPAWDDFIAPFTQPAFAGSMYDIIETKVQNAQITAQTEEETRAAMNLRTHWVNTSLVLLSGGPTRTTQWLSSAWLALLDRLLVAKQPLSQAEIEAVEALFAQYNLL